MKPKIVTAIKQAGVGKHVPEVWAESVFDAVTPVSGRKPRSADSAESWC